MQIISTGQELKAWRRASAWKQPYLAAFLGVTIETIQQWERSPQIPYYVTLRLLDLIL